MFDFYFSSYYNLILFHFCTMFLENGFYNQWFLPKKEEPSQSQNFTALTIVSDKYSGSEILWKGLISHILYQYWYAKIFMQNSVNIVHGVNNFREKTPVRILEACWRGDELQYKHHFLQLFSNNSKGSFD